MLRVCAYLFDVRVVEYVCMGGYKDNVGCQWNHGRYGIAYSTVGIAGRLITGRCGSRGISHRSASGADVRGTSPA